MNPTSWDESRRAYPEILLAEDDDISREFLIDALTRLPATVTAVADGTEARQRLIERRFDIALLDRGLPSLDAPAIREAVLSAGGSNADTPMLALSADVDPALRARFLALGFIDLLAKPITAQALRRAVRAALPAATVAWDDEQALAAANGNHNIAERLRTLMLADLPGQRDALQRTLTQGDHSAAHELLHRMKAACAFCGAARLATACSALDDALGDAAASNDIPNLVAAFDKACASILGEAD